MTISPYVVRLRREIGTELLLLPSVTVLVENEDGQILLVRHRGAQQWSTVGGMIEPEEEPTVAAVREVKEETNLDIELLELVTACGGPECVVEYANGDRVSYVTIVYRARSIAGVAVADEDEVAEVRWTDSGELLELDLDRFARHLFAEALPRLGQPI